ncbi:MAG: transposase [Firmicutes bacterium]|nr:transposase [Bacillota bacterium]
MRQERLPVIREKMAVTDLYTDGAYYRPEEEEPAPGITMHYTNMSGSKPAPEKLPLTAFVILDQQIIVSCPNSQHPAHSYFDKQGKTLSAYFDLHLCQQCPMREACPVKLQKKSAVLRVSQKAVSAAQTRERISVKCEHRESTSKRAAIEGTNSALKRSHGAGRLQVRTLARCKVVFGMKVIGHNFRQLVRFCQGDIREKAKSFNLKTHQGVLAPI